MSPCSGWLTLSTTSPVSPRNGARLKPATPRPPPPPKPPPPPRPPPPPIPPPPPPPTLPPPEWPPPPPRARAAPGRRAASATPAASPRMASAQNRAGRRLPVTSSLRYGCQLEAGGVSGGPPACGSCGSCRLVPQEGQNLAAAGLSVPHCEHLTV